MAEIRCPGCGAGIDTDGKFCKYCGMKLPDDTQRIEVNGTINHNIHIRKERINQTKIAKTEAKAAEARAKAEIERLNALNRAKMLEDQRLHPYRDTIIGVVGLLGGFAVFALIMYLAATH